jgi:tetratricopeptide (TPR) repeat protein
MKFRNDTYTAMKNSLGYGLAAALLAAAAAPVLAADKPSAYFCEDVKQPFFRVSADGLVTPARPGSTAAAFRMPKPEGVTRVFVAGESAAMILSDGPARPGLEIINCGMGGYESYRIGAVLKEILAYQPDLVVVLSGNNEGGADPCPGFKPELRRRELKLLERYYSASGSGAPLRDALIKAQELRLRSMASAAAKKSVPLVLCSLPGNMLMPPQSPPPVRNTDYAAGLLSFETGAYAEAAASFSLLPGDPLAVYYRGRSLYAAGEPEKAAPLLDQAADLAPAQERAGPARNAMLRRAAAAGGACLADLDLAFRNASPSGITGFGMFDDGVHWKPSYNKLAWDAIFSAAAGCGVKAAGAYRGLAAVPAGRPEETTAAKRISYALSWMDGKTLNERAAAELESLLTGDARALEQAVSSRQALRKFYIRNFWSSGPEEISEAVFADFLAHAALAYLRAGRPAAALKLAERSLRSRPWSGPARLLRARLFFRLGRVKEASAALTSLAGNQEYGPAAAALAAVLGLDAGDYCYGTSFLVPGSATKKLSDSGIARLRAGDAAGAGKLLKEAVEADGTNTEALISLCSLKRRQGDPAGAVNFCVRAAGAAMARCSDARSRGLAADAWLGAASAELFSGRKAAAAVYFKRALGTAPPGWAGLAEAKAGAEK